MRLIWGGILPQSRRSPIHFPVRAHAWAAGLVPGLGHVQEATDVSLPLFLPTFLSLNKQNLFKKYKVNEP